MRDASVEMSLLSVFAHVSCRVHSLTERYTNVDERAESTMTAAAK